MFYSKSTLRDTTDKHADSDGAHKNPSSTARTMSSRSNSISALAASDQASINDNMMSNNVYEAREERSSTNSPRIHVGDGFMFTSLCAAFSNLNPIVPPVVRRHSNRWRMIVSIIISLSIFSASLAHLRSIFNHNGRRSVMEEHHHGDHHFAVLRSLRFVGGTFISAERQQEPQLRTIMTEKEADDAVTNEMLVR